MEPASSQLLQETMNTPTIWLILNIVLYLVGAFVAFELNPNKWVVVKTKDKGETFFNCPAGRLTFVGIQTLMIFTSILLNNSLNR